MNERLGSFCEIYQRLSSESSISNENILKRAQSISRSFVFSATNYASASIGKLFDAINREIKGAVGSALLGWHFCHLSIYPAWVLRHSTACQPSTQCPSFVWHNLRFPLWICGNFDCQTNPWFGVELLELSRGSECNHTRRKISLLKIDATAAKEAVKLPGNTCVFM